MKTSDILFVALSPTALAVARQAAMLAFPHRAITLLPDLATALASPPAAGPQLLVLADPDGTAVLAAGQILEKNGLPRWAVVVMGPGESDLAEAVPVEEWNPSLLARVFRATLLQHELLWENLRLRGDLKTVARRISHDLRTPVGCIHTTSDMLPELDAASVASMAGVIKQSSTEISEIIDRVSFLLKASADSYPPTPVKMGQVFEQVQQQLAGEIKRAGAVITPPAHWPEVTGVGPWLYEIWTNLLGNAVKHGGTFPRITITWDCTADEYRFVISDHGPGVPASRLAALFAPFDQLHDVRSSGIGLSIVQRLVTLQGGSCGYEKSERGGSTFHFTLPATVLVA